VTVPGTEDASPDPADHDAPDESPGPPETEGDDPVTVPGTDGSPEQGAGGEPAFEAPAVEAPEDMEVYRGPGQPSPAAGGALVPGDDDAYYEIDPNGVPLGIWRYDDGADAWIFVSLVTPGGAPPTSDDSHTSSALTSLIVSAIIMAALAAPPVRSKSERKNRRIFRP
jgi:hypothetical protein